MKSEKWQEIEQIVDIALSLDESEREKYIKQECAGDEKLRTRVTEFLKGIETSREKNYLQNPDRYRELKSDMQDSGSRHFEKSLIGQKIDKYVITDLIGHGGMGSVFLAKRVDEAYDKNVAVKVMRRGFDTPSNIARFKRERNILATLDHPNIARLLDGGVTEDGLPYLVMEYVEGLPIYEYCNRRQLSIEKRLQLFKSVCRAVKHAHNNAVIHRDLKPSNILVTNEGNLKILDFGIAKFLESEEMGTNIFQTQTGARILTLGYAAPEQLDNRSMTTASDTFALGLLLYELLAGIKPYDMEGKKWTEIEKLICEVTPKLPSVSFGKLPLEKRKQIANERSSTPTLLAKKLKGDLDAIIMKALRKEPETRYSSAEQMLKDLQRREHNKPIIARKDTFRYKFSKFVKRHKIGLSAAAGFFILIVGFVAFYTFQITEERNKAQREAEKAQLISDFLISTFQAGNPNIAESDTLTARELLNKGLNKVNQLDNKSIKAEMLTVLGESFTGLGDYQTASDLLKKAIRLSNQSKAEDSRITQANALHNLGTLHTVQQEFKESLSYLKKAYNIRSQELGDSDPKTVQSLTKIGVAFRNTGKLDSAEYFVREAVKIQNNNTAYSDSALLKTKAELAYVLRKKGDLKESEQLYKEVISRSKTETGDKSSLVSNYNNLAYLYDRKQEYEKAEKYYNKALVLSAEIRGSSHPLTNMIRKNLATTLTVNDKLEEATYYWKENIKHTQKRYSRKHWRTASAHTTIGYFMIFKREKYEQAENYIKDGIQIYEQVLGSDHTWTAYAKGLLTGAEYMMKNYQVSDSLFNLHYDIFRKNLGSLDRTNEGQIKKLINIYTTKTDTINKRYVDAYQELLEKSS